MGSFTDGFSLKYRKILTNSDMTRVNGLFPWTIRWFVFCHELWDRLGRFTQFITFPRWTFFFFFYQIQQKMFILDPNRSSFGSKTSKQTLKKRLYHNQGLFMLFVEKTTDDFQTIFNVKTRPNEFNLNQMNFDPCFQDALLNCNC